MDIDKAIKNRRSIRNFLKKPIDKKIIEELINSASLAPSACNIQGWKFIIIDNQNIKNKLFDYGGSIIIKQAPIGILVLYDDRTAGIEYKDYIQSASAAIQNILLKATSINLGSCWICHLPTKRKLKKIFNIPNHYSPIAYILIGHPKFKPIPVPRKYKIDEIMNYNTFSDKWHKKNINFVALFIKKLLIKIYFLMPVWLKTRGLNNLLNKKFVKKFKN